MRALSCASISKHSGPLMSSRLMPPNVGSSAATAADDELVQAEKVFSDLTTALADITAQRNQFENAAREQSERVARLTAEIAAIEHELATLHTADNAPLTAAVEG